MSPHGKPLDDMLAVLERAFSLIHFPEGTRTPGPEAAPFNPGLYHLAKLRPMTELIPVYIANLNRILPKGHVLPVPLLCSVNFGAPIRRELHEGKEAFWDRARTAVTQLRAL